MSDIAPLYVNGKPGTTGVKLSQDFLPRRRGVHTYLGSILANVILHATNRPSIGHSGPHSTLSYCFARRNAASPAEQYVSYLDADANQPSPSFCLLSTFRFCRSVGRPVGVHRWGRNGRMLLGCKGHWLLPSITAMINTWPKRRDSQDIPSSS